MFQRVINSIDEARKAIQEMAKALDSLRIAIVPIPLHGVRRAPSDNIDVLLTTATTPIIQYTNGDTDSCLRLNWAASNVDPIVFEAPLYRLDADKPVQVMLRAKMAGSTDTPAFDADSYFDEGDTKVSDASSALTASYAEYAITIAADDVPADSRTLTCELTPQAHGTDAIYLTALWVQYYRRMN